MPLNNILRSFVCPSYRSDVHSSLPSDTAAAQRDPTSMELVQGDFLELDWSDADVVYANATRFDEPLMEAISKKAESLKKGAR